MALECFRTFSPLLEYTAGLIKMTPKVSVSCIGKKPHCDSCICSVECVGRSGSSSSGLSPAM